MSSDAKMILVKFKEWQWRVFDTATAKAISPMFDVPFKEDSMRESVLFSPDLSTVLVFDMKEATVFDVRSGKRLATIPLPTGPDDLEPGSAQFTAGGARCLVMGGQGTVTTYGTKDWKPIGKPMVHPPADDAYDFHFSVSDDGKWLATSDTPGEHNFKGQLQLWDAVENTPLGEPIVAMNGVTARFLGGDRVVILPERGDVNVRELPSTNIAYSLISGDHVFGPALDVSKDQKWIVAWGEDEKIDLVDATSGKVADFYRGPAKIEQVMIAPDSSSCYVVFDNSAFEQEKHYDNYVVRFKLPEMKITHTFRSTDSDPRVSLSPDGKRLMVLQGAADQERVLFLDTATLKPIN
jgi:WD40 repeat protein